MITTAPGEEAQVDYGDGPMVRHLQTGKDRRTRLFVLILGYSRKSGTAAGVAVEHAGLGRAPRAGVSSVGWDGARDRPRQSEEGVLTPDIYDPALNPLYRDVFAHYGVVALPCRVGRKPARTAAEDLLELIMRRYERASTLLTSNRPVADWGKLLGDTAAVTALLDRLLHHAHVRKFGPRSWRTKVQTGLRADQIEK